MGSRLKRYSNVLYHSDYSVTIMCIIIVTITCGSLYARQYSLAYNSVLPESRAPGNKSTGSVFFCLAFPRLRRSGMHLKLNIAHIFNKPN